MKFMMSSQERKYINGQNNKYVPVTQPGRVLVLHTRSRIGKRWFESSQEHKDVKFL